MMFRSLGDCSWTRPSTPRAGQGMPRKSRSLAVGPGLPRRLAVAGLPSRHVARRACRPKTAREGHGRRQSWSHHEGPALQSCRSAIGAGSSRPPPRAWLAAQRHLARLWLWSNLPQSIEASFNSTTRAAFGPGRPWSHQLLARYAGRLLPVVQTVATARRHPAKRAGGMGRQPVVVLAAEEEPAQGQQPGGRGWTPGRPFHVKRQLDAPMETRDAWPVLLRPPCGNT